MLRNQLDKLEFGKDKSMRFFISEKQRQQEGDTCYFEFQKGQKNDPNNEWEFWKEDSLLLHMDIVDEISLYKIIPDFNYYGITVIDREKWHIIQSNAEKANGIINEVITELKFWADENFKEFDYFVIYGI